MMSMSAIRFSQYQYLGWNESFSKAWSISIYVVRSFFPAVTTIVTKKFGDILLDYLLNEGVIYVY